MIPSFFNKENADKVYRVDYSKISDIANQLRNLANISPSKSDTKRVALLLIDCQNTFCIPGFELFVGGNSGSGAVEDSVRTCEFIYNNLKYITNIFLTKDTHNPNQVFHPLFWVDKDGNHPNPMTMISYEDVVNGVWKVNPRIDKVENIEKFALYYTKALKDNGKYILTIWPYHAISTGIGHAIVSVIEEAVFFHSIARGTNFICKEKGDLQLTEMYSVFNSEVACKESKDRCFEDHEFISDLLQYDTIIIAGQAKSHCVAWSIEDLLNEFDAIAYEKQCKSYQELKGIVFPEIYLLDDCTSPVVVPGIIDFTDQADQAYERFVERGCRIIKSNISIEHL